LLDNICHRYLKKRINELVVPSLMVREPEILDLGRINKVVLLHDEIVIDSVPMLTPGGAPNRNVADGDLVEGVVFEYC
jgi:hypothetical protein